ncbi:MAG: sensor histidine kinase [Promicromonosporaceae bacterium]|nr:sensor histidine kinase [Promicromonosporaceae bacterium]
MTTAQSEFGQHERAWDKQLFWWHFAFWVMLVLAGISVVFAQISPQAKAITIGALAVQGLAYPLFGKPALEAPQLWGATWRRGAPVYLAIWVLVLIVIASQAGVAPLLLVPAITQAWSMAPSRRWGIVVVSLMVVAVAFGWWLLLDQDFSRLVGQLPFLLTTFIFAVGLGLFIINSELRSAERARLVDQLREAQAEVASAQHAAGVTAERERLAREVHDTLAQGFMSVVIQAQVARAGLAARNDDATLAAIDQMEATARDNLAEARGLVAASSPVELHGENLPDAIRRVTSRWSGESGIAATVLLDEVGALPTEVEIVLLRALQESLTNVARHSAADSVSVVLSTVSGSFPTTTDATTMTEARVRLDITDNGVGFDPGTAVGYGLAGMRARAEAAQGSLVIGPAKSGSAERPGTRISVTLPMGEPHE